MSSLLGIVRPFFSLQSPERDTLCFQNAPCKFPTSFKDAEKNQGHGLVLLGDFQVSQLSERGSRLILYGSVFNRDEIAAIVGIQPRSEHYNDADLILDLVRVKGIESVKTINGQFIIIYHNYELQKIRIINDHFGIQQMVYYQDKDIFLFGSEVKFLMAHPDCPRGIDWDTALRRPGPHIVLGSYKSYTTWFKGINLLPEASILEIDLETGETSIKNYWRPQNVSPSPEDNRTVGQVMAEYVALLGDAVKLRMGEGVTYSLMSGGLDSSAICGLAAKYGTLKTFSIISQTTVLEDTTFFCHRMAEEMKFRNSQFLVPYRELCFNKLLWKQRVWRAESPVNHTDSLTKTLLHCAIGRSHPEVKNMLTGTGSDQMNGGLVGYVAAPGATPEESWSNFCDAILDVENRNLVARNEEALWQLRKFTWRDFIAASGGARLEENPWMIYLDGAIHSQAYSLLWDEQRASASHGHNTFYPFLDYRIADFIAAIPEHLHRYLFYDKQILRVPAKDFVPDYIVNKAKIPYNLPEYDFRMKLYAFLTTDDETSLFKDAFGDIDKPHPVINKKYLHQRIQAMREKPEIMEWLNIMHIINLGLLEQLPEREEADMDYESGIAVPEKINFDDPVATKIMLEKRLAIATPEDLVNKIIGFGDNCSLLLDVKSNKYVLSKNNNLAYELEPEYVDWTNFLVKIDNKCTAKQILSDLNICFETIEEFFRLSLKEEILVTKENLQAN